MPETTIIIGGPGVGKSDAVIARLTQGYAHETFWDALLLTPSMRHGDQLRRRLVGRCGVAMGLHVERLSQFAQRLTETPLVDDDTPSMRAADPAVAEELLSRVTRTEVESGGASYFKPIAGTRGLGRLIRAAVFNLVSEGVDVNQFRAAARDSGMRSLEALASVYSAFIEELSRRRWIHPASQPFRAAGAVTEGALLPQLVILDGFQIFRQGELALLKEVGRKTSLTVTLDPSAGKRAAYDFDRLKSIFPHAEIVRLEGPDAAPSTQIFGGESGDHEAQLRDIARLIKRRLVRENGLRPSDFALAFRQFVPHLSLARQVFAEYQLPLDPSSGEPLASQPLAAWLRRLLRLGLDGWRLADLAAVLESGFANLRRWKLSGDDVRAFKRHAVERKSWRDHEALLKTAQTLEDERARAAITHTLNDLRSLLEEPAGTLGDWALRWHDALFGDNPLVHRDCYDRPDVSAGLDKIRECFDELVRVERSLGGTEASLESFANWLDSRMEAPSLLKRDVGGVFLAPMRSLSGLRFDSVFVGGLIEGEFPAPRATTSLLNENAIDALSRSGLKLPPEPGLSEDELWKSASSRADATLYLWKTRIDSRGRPASGSYYYDQPDLQRIQSPALAPDSASSARELAIACSAAWRSGGLLRPREDPAWPTVRQAVRVEQLRRSYQNAANYEGALDPNLVPFLTEEGSLWSASRMESYRTCAFQFFGHYALGLSELDEEMVEADAATRGTVVHDILEHVLDPLQKQGLPLDPDTLDGVVESLRRDGPGIWNQAPAKYGFGSAPMWAFALEDVLDNLERMLTKEATFSRKLGVQRIYGIEEKIEAELPLEPPMKVTARLDRLDVGPRGLVVVDYKSGAEIRRSHVLNEKRIQLQLYAYLGLNSMDAESVVARYAWLNPRHRDWDLDSNEDDGDTAIQNIVNVANSVRDSVAAGDFRVNPQTQPCPSYCDFRHVCRVNEFSRHKWSQK